MPIVMGATQMSSIIIMAFTSKGYDLAVNVAERLKDTCDYIVEAYRVSNLREFVPTVFRQGNVLLFIGAVGIAVRGIAPLLKSKTSDPAVIVVDDSARFVIPILSGHIGGANEFALKVSNILNATPIITTATDVNHVFAVDTFAVQNGYTIANPDRIKDISSYLLEGKEVGLSTEFKIADNLPTNIKLQSKSDVGIRINCDTRENPFKRTLHLLPKCYHIGIGARKNTDADKLEMFFRDTLEKNSICIKCVGSISSFFLKRDEPAICKLAEKYGIPYITYLIEELLPYENLFTVSEFVKQTTGIGNICETAAYVSSKKGEIIHTKTSKNGMTIAIAKEEWRIIFENTNDRN